MVARLIPTFRLLSKCKRDLEEIDAVLGCGVSHYLQEAGQVLPP